MNRPNLLKSCQYYVFLLVMLLQVIQGCVTTKPSSVDPMGYKHRSKSSVSEEVDVTVAVLTITEAEAIYGVKLASKGIQPVWLEIQNKGAEPYWFLPSGLDPEYFSPSEATFAFYRGNEKKIQQIKDKFQNLAFQNPIHPGKTVAGFVLVNLDEDFKAVDIDLISRKVKSFSFILADPDFKADYKEINARAEYTDEDIINIEDEIELRRVLEELPCCTTNSGGDKFGDPLNLVLVGEINEILPALIRRNWHATEIVWTRSLMRMLKSFLKGERYRYSPISALHFYGRRQDIGFQKARGTINERNHMRFWKSPILFRGKKVYVGQISRDIGVKFTLKSPTISTHIIDPDVDEARRYFVEDLVYSQTVSRIGYVKGVGAASMETPRMNLVGDPFFTDGLRTVLFFESGSYDLSDIEMIQWESPSAQNLTLNTRLDSEPVTMNESLLQKRALTQKKTVFGHLLQS